MRKILAYKEPEPQRTRKAKETAYRTITRELSKPMFATPCFSRRSRPISSRPVSKIVREIRYTCWSVIAW
jgi:hypothetical protein